MTGHASADASADVGGQEHVCDWCGEAIPKGSSYDTWNGVGMDGWFLCKQHLECRRACGRAPYWYTADGWGFGAHERGTDHEKGCNCQPSCAAAYADERAREKASGGAS